MRKFIFSLAILFLLPFIAYSEDSTPAVLIDLALQGQRQKTGFYLNSKSCLNTSKSNLHVAYDQQRDVLIFGYFSSSTGMIENYVWDKKEGKTSIISCKVDEPIDTKKAVNISEREMQGSALKFRSDWLTCK